MKLSNRVKQNIQIRGSSIYLGSSILSKMIPFLLLPIMTKYLTPSEYGMLSIYLTIITLYIAFIGMAIDANITKEFFKISKEELAKYIGNIFYILAFSFVFYLLVTYIVSLYCETIFSIPSKWVLLAPLIGIMTMINKINTTILINEQRAYIFGIFEISNTFIKMSLTVVLLIIFSLNWYSQILGILIGSCIFFVIGIFYMKTRQYIVMKLDKEKIKSILIISIPLIPHVVGSIIIAMSDRLFIENMVSLEMVGVYSIGYMFGMVVILFTDAFIKAWSPWFYQSLIEPTEHKKKEIVKYTYIYIIGIFILAIFISLIGQYILPYFVDEKFYEAKEFILWIALGYAMQGVYKIFFPYLMHMNKTAFLAMSTMTAAIINLVLNYFFIQYYGTIGAAYATIVSFFFSAILVFWYQSKNYNMPWRLDD